MQGDGVESGRGWLDTVDDRHFYIVTLDVTANTDERNDFQTSCLYVSKVDAGDESNIKLVQKHGDSSLIYMNPDNSSNISVNIEKGKTVTFTLGVVVDDDIADNACLTIKKRYIDVDHNNELAVERIEYACLMLNSEVDYD